MSVEDFLNRQLGIPSDYLKERVQTVFLDGRALDDFSAALVTDGATIALSAAMPGLAGAVLRRGGFYGAMRRSITHDTRAAWPADEAVTATVKLFNLVAREIGPGLLQKGVRLQASALADLLSRLGRAGAAKILAARVGSRPVSPEALADALGTPGVLDLTVAPAPAARQ
jgi:hypothetical protein